MVRFSYNEEDYVIDDVVDSMNEMDWEHEIQEDEGDEHNHRIIADNALVETEERADMSLCLAVPTYSWSHSTNTSDIQDKYESHEQPHDEVRYHRDVQQLQQQEYYNQEREQLQAQVAMLREQMAQQQVENSHELGLESFEQKDSKKRKKGSSWLWYVALVMIAHIIARYGPVAPPPPLFGATRDSHQEGEQLQYYRSWEEFFVKEISQLITSILVFGYQLPMYVSHWCVKEIQTDLNQWYEEMTRPPLCSLHLSSDQLRKHFPRALIGQQMAMEAVEGALTNWIHHDSSYPLLLYLTGSYGVGKTELANQIASLSFLQCSSKTSSSSSSSSFSGLSHNNHDTDGILVLQGRDFTATRTTAEIDDPMARTPSGITNNSPTFQVKQKLYDTIFRHVQQRNGAGAIIIVQHVEKFQQGLLEDLCRDLRATRTNAKTTIATLSGSSEYQQHIPEHPATTATTPGSLLPRLDDSNLNFQKVMFIFTSSIGSKTIAQNIKAHGGIQFIPKLNLELSLNHEIDTYYGVENDSDVASYFHAVAPFYPIQKEDMEQIFRRKMDDWWSQRQQRQRMISPTATKERAAASTTTTTDETKDDIFTLQEKFMVTDVAVEAILNSKVEYITIKKRPPSDSVIITFASTGGKPFVESSSIMNKLTTQMGYLPSPPPPTMTTQEHLDSSSSMEVTCILDYDSATLEGVFFWCNLAYDNEKDNGKDNDKDKDINNNNDNQQHIVISNSKYEVVGCTEAWRFLL